MVIVFSDATVIHPHYRTALDDVLSGEFLRDSKVFFDSFVEGTLVGYGLYILIPILMFVSGGLFGDLIEKWRSRNPITSGAVIAKRIAEKFVSPNSKSFDKVVKVLTVLGPSALSLTGTVLGILFR